jgi:hypothetical protein
MLRTFRRRLRGPLLLVLGLLAGFLVAVLGILTWVQDAGRRRALEPVVGEKLNLPREAFTLEKVTEDGIIRGRLNDVVLLDRGGDTVVTAPYVSFTLDARSLSREGPVVFSSAEIRRAFLRLRQAPDGTWNFTRIWRVEAKGQPVQGPAGQGEEASRPIVLRDVRLVGARAVIFQPWTPPAPGATFTAARQPESVRYRGRTYTVRTLSDLNARLSSIRVGGNVEWRVDVAEAAARVTNPDLRVAALRGFVESPRTDVIRFGIDELRTEHSVLEGSGTMNLAEKAGGYDVTLRAHPLDFRDLQGLGFRIPEEGTATFTLGVKSLPGGRTAFRVSDAEAATLGSRVAGHATTVTGPGGAFSFSDTRLSLEPLRISTLEELGLVKPTGLAGEVRGTVSSVAEVREGSGALRLDLEARVVPRDQLGAEPSVLTAAGNVALTGDTASPVRFEGLRVEAQPLYLATLRPLLTQSSAYLQGAVRGGVTLEGTLADVRFTAGDLSYQVGSAPATRVAGLAGRVIRGAQTSWTVEGRADPLALGTLSQLFPALPFRNELLSGPFAASGEGDRVRFDANFQSTAGGISLHAAATLGDVPRFDLNARLEALRPGGLLAVRAPLEGPLTGTVVASGTTEDFAFDVNLAQGTGRLALHGGVRRPGGTSPQFDVAGRVDNFRIGLLLGRPNLLPSPVTGPISLSGGGRRPYRFAVDLRGALGMLNLSGWYQPGTVPSYLVNGQVQGLDVSGLPGLSSAPETQLTGALYVAGQGTTPETFAGTVRVDLSPASRVGGVPIEAGTVRVAAENGVLRVDTLVLAVRGARAEASGQLGLTRPGGQGLSFQVNVPDLAAVAGLFPRFGAEIPQVAGAIQGSGVVSGTLRAPALRAQVSGRGVRYQEYAAGTLALEVDVRREPAGWAGRVAGTGTALVLPGGQTLASARLESGISPERVSFGVSAVRDAETDLTAKGTLELADGTVTGALLDTLSLRLAGTTWSLVDRARVAYTPETGLAVENLQLRRSGIASSGYLDVEGTLPPSGMADLRIHAGGIDVAELRRVFPQIPNMTGVVWMDAALQGPVADPRLDLRARVAELSFGDVRMDSLSLSGAYADGRLNATGGIFLAGDSVVRLRAGVPMRLSLGGMVPGVDLVRDGPLDVALVADSVPVALVADAAPGLRDGTGVLHADVRVTGTPDLPRVAGSLTVNDGGFRIERLGTHWTDVGARIALDGNLIRVEALSARSGGGTAQLSGTVRLDEPGRPQVFLDAVFHDFEAIDDRRTAKLDLSGRLGITGRFPEATVSGDITVDDGTIHIPNLAEREVDIIDAEVGELGADTSTVAAASGAAALLAKVNAQNLTINVGESVWLESEDARVQIQGALGVERFGGATRVSGELQAVRGTYRLRVGPLVREFDIVSGTVRFLGTPDLNPLLDIRAANEVRTVDASGQVLTIFVDVTGTLQNPRVTLSSDTRPPLPESELISLLVFGRRVTEVGALEQGLAQQLILEEAVGGLLFSNLEQELQQAGVLDYVRVRSRFGSDTRAGGAANPFEAGLGLLGSPTLELGKEVARDLFVTLEVQNFLTEPRVGIAGDYQISPSSSLRLAWEPVRRDPLLTLLKQNGTDRQVTVEWRRRWEYGRPPTRGSMPRPPTRDTLPGRVAPPVLSPPVTAPSDTVSAQPAPGGSGGAAEGGTAPPPPPPPPPSRETQVPVVEGRRRKW